MVSMKKSGAARFAPAVVLAVLEAEHERQAKAVGFRIPEHADKEGEAPPSPKRLNASVHH